MLTQPPLEDGQQVQEIIAQYSILEQTEAVVTAQIGSTQSTRPEALLQEVDLIDAANGDVPPPAYGDIYGEIRDKKDGLSAHITDDGRVNIRINHFNRRLSQIFTPASDQHVQDVQDSQPTSLPYIPGSLGGKDGASPPPSLNVVMQVVGSRGDVQPFIALGKVLKETYGHRVRLATHPNFKSFVQDNGLEFFSIGGDPSRLMAFMVKNPGLMPGFRSMLSGDIGQRRTDVAEYIQGCWRSCYEAGDGLSSRAFDDDLSDPDHKSAAKPFVADCIIANPPSFAHIHCAERLGIPLHIMFTMPYSPTQVFPHPLANIQASSVDPQLTNYISYVMIEILVWQGLGDIINRFREKCLGLDPVSLIWAPGMLQRLKIPHTYSWSPSLIPKPKDWGSHLSISGFSLLNSPLDYTPMPDLQAFLDGGTPPIYIGFGSIILDDPNAMTELIFQAARKIGQRVLLSKGWGGIGASQLQVPNNVFMLGNVPHDWLFKHVSCVVHHGGAGTTAAGITAGRPTLIIPFFGDQPFWGAMVARAGAGPDPIPHKQLTADKLATAIFFCLRDETLERAKGLASKIAAERGSDVGSQLFHQYLDVDRLRCILAPSRAAAWRIKRTQVRLSAFAACTLSNANLLDFHDLKLFRSQEYYPDEGPWDPISGFATAVFGAITSMAMGVADFPSETIKALNISSRSSRRQSQTVLSTVEKKSESYDGSSNSFPSLSDLSIPKSNVNSRSRSDVLPARGSKHNDAHAMRNHRGNGSSSRKNDDMLRLNSIHTDKGIGRIMKTALQSPITLSMSITEGFHNAPKLWGDDTVRPPQQVVDLKSGARAVGKEFAFGWYDGLSGLVTQPWKGAQKEGASGFLKGVGKGLGGFVTKPGAALFGIPSYMMKGVHKEVQKLFGRNVQHYIVTSRAAQGYDEWLQSSEEEKQDVILRWKLIQKYLKKKHNPDEMMRDILKAQQGMDKENRAAPHNRERAASFSSSVISEAALAQNPENPAVTMGDPELPSHPAYTASLASLRTAEMNDSLRACAQAQQISRGDIDEDANVEKAAPESVSDLRLQHQEALDHRADEQTLCRIMATTEAEAQQHAREALRYEEELKRVIARSLVEHRRGSGDNEWESPMSFDGDGKEFDKLQQASDEFRRRTEQMDSVPETSSFVQRAPSYDPGHLMGTTQSEFAAQQHGQQDEKSPQEKIEEKIVMEYVRKQSLLEHRHRFNKGKGRATTSEDQDDEDFQSTLRLSLQRHESVEGHRYGEASRT